MTRRTGTHRKHRPCPAARARTLACGVAPVTMSSVGIPETVPLAHATDCTGRPLLLVPDDSPFTGVVANVPFGEIPVLLTITDLAPVAVAHRVRARAWLAGWLSIVPDSERLSVSLHLAEHHPVGALLDVGASTVVLRMDVAEIHIEDVWGNAYIEPEAYAAAAPDPLVGCEAELLQHLDAHHADELLQLARLAGERAHRHRGPVHPVAIDQFGLRLRLGSAPGSLDIRLEFPHPVHDMATLRHALNLLLSLAPSDQR